MKVTGAERESEMDRPERPPTHIDPPLLEVGMGISRYAGHPERLRSEMICRFHVCRW